MVNKTAIVKTDIWKEPVAIDPDYGSAVDRLVILDALTAPEYHEGFPLVYSVQVNQMDRVFYCSCTHSKPNVQLGATSENV